MLIALVWYLATLGKLTKCVLTMIACINDRAIGGRGGHASYCNYYAWLHMHSWRHTGIAPLRIKVVAL